MKEIEADIYEWTVTANKKLFKWNTASMLISKADQTQLCLTFNYYYVFKDSSESYIKLFNKVHDFLFNFLHQCFTQFNIKHTYWTVEVHSTDWHYFAFIISELRQL